MKHVIFLFASFLTFCFSHAQKPTAEEARTSLAQLMSRFTTAVQPVYRPGQTYTQFELALVGKERVSKQGKALLLKAFGYLSSNTTTARIIATDSGLEAANGLAVMETLRKAKPSSDGSELFGATVGQTSPLQQVAGYPEGPNIRNCKWYQLGCHLSNIQAFMLYSVEMMLAEMGMGIVYPQNLSY